MEANRRQEDVEDQESSDSPADQQGDTVDDVSEKSNEEPGNGEVDIALPSTSGIQSRKVVKTKIEKEEHSNTDSTEEDENKDGAQGRKRTSTPKKSAQRLPHRTVRSKKIRKNVMRRE